MHGKEIAHLLCLKMQFYIFIFSSGFCRKRFNLSTSTFKWTILRKKAENNINYKS